MAGLGQRVLFLLEGEHGLINVVVSPAGYMRWQALPRGEPLLLVGDSAAARAWGECERARPGHHPLHLHDAAR